MIRSMTAFGRRQDSGDWGTLTWELRSVNHRYLETFVRMPEELRAQEQAVRDTVARRIRRGKIECHLRFQAPVVRAQQVEVNEARAAAVLAAAERVRSMAGDGAALDALEVLRWPGVVEEPEGDLEPVQRRALELLEAALEDLVETRRTEGARLRELLVDRAEAMSGIVAKVRERRPEVMTALRQKFLDRLTDRLGDVGAEPEPGRLEQELAMIAQRLDVDEELDRLDSHLREIASVVDRQDPVGRRLDFLMQELNREANTLASKSADLETTQHAVELKVLIEQMREQVQNIE